jgi:hypothetical protein
MRARLVKVYQGSTLEVGFVYEGTISDGGNFYIHGRPFGYLFGGYFEEVKDEKPIIEGNETLGVVGMPEGRYKIALHGSPKPKDCYQKPNKYSVQINGESADVYDVLKAFNVVNPALQHLIKKALKVGNRGHKDADTDYQDIIDSAIRAKELG